MPEENDSKPILERLYIAPNVNERRNFERLVKVAIQNGFKHPILKGQPKEQQIEKLIEKTNCFLVLERWNDELTIEEKPLNQVFAHVGNEDVKIYLPKTAITWIRLTIKKNNPKKRKK